MNERGRLLRPTVVSVPNLPSVPNVLSAPGERAARERAEVIFLAADGLSPGDLNDSIVPRRDLEEREVLLVDLERAADAHDRGALLDEARGRLRDALLARASGMWTSNARPMPFGTGGRAQDVVEVLLAIEDAVSVAVVEDLLEPASAAALANPGRWLLGLDPLPGAAAGRAPGEASGSPAVRDETSDVEPADTEAADVDEPGDAEGLSDVEAADAEEPEVDPRARRAAVFAIVAAVTIPGALAGGFAADQLPLLVIIVAAVALLAWLFG